MIDTRWSRWRVSLAEIEDGRPLCLSLANTRHWRNSRTPQETLQTYADLARWAAARRIVDDENALNRVALDRPAAEAELERALALREAIAAWFTARAHSRTGEDAYLARIIASFNDAASHLKLTLVDGALIPQSATSADPLAVPRWQAALSAIGLAASAAAARVKQCADDRGCGWLFLDATRNGSRRFCFSSECGNRARQARFRAKHELSSVTRA